MKPRLRYVSVLAVIAVAAVAFVAARPDEAPELPRESRIYRSLVAGDYSDVAAAAGMRLRGVTGMLPPAEADREEHWLVYVGFEGRDGRHRIAYQVIPPGEDEEWAEVIAGYDPCARDEVGWDCYATVEGVSTKGQAACLRPRCQVTRREAKELMDLAVDHLTEVLAETA